MIKALRSILGNEETYQGSQDPAIAEKSLGKSLGTAKGTAAEEGS